MSEDVMVGAKKSSGLGSIFLVVFLDILGFSLVLPFLAEESRDTFGTSAFTGTLLASVYSLMQFLFVPVWGRLSDRVGRRPILMWSVFVTACAMAGLGVALVFAQSFWWLFVPRVIGGIATANLGTASAYIADVTKPEDRARGMGVIGIAFGLGFIVGPAVGGALSAVPIHGRLGGIPCFLAAGFSLVNFAWVALGLRESLPPEKRATSTRRLVPLDLPALKATLAQEGVGRAVLVSFTLILSFTVLDQTFRYFTKDKFGMSPLDTGLVLMFIGVMAGFVQGAMRQLTKRFDESVLIKIGVAMQAAGFASLAFSPVAGRPGLYAACTLIAFGNGLTQPSIPAFISKRANASEQGATLGTNQSMSSLARMFGPALGGWLYGALGPSSPYLAGAIGMGVAFVVALALAPQRNTSTQMS